MGRSRPDRSIRWGEGKRWDSPSASRKPLGSARSSHSRQAPTRCPRRRGGPALARDPLRVRVGPDEGGLVVLERVALGVPEEHELAPRGPNLVLVADARTLEAADRQFEVVDDNLRNDAALPEVLGLGARV